MQLRSSVVAALAAVITGCETTPSPASRLEHIVVVYAENRSFDNLYGLFPGANGIANATPASYVQVDRDGSVLASSAAGVERQGTRSGVSEGSAEQAVPHRRAADQPAAIGGDAGRDPQVLPEPGADQRWSQRPFRRGHGCRRAGDGLLRRIDAAVVVAGRSSTRWPTISSWAPSEALTSTTSG